jgi:hypothetical protein
MSESQLKSQLSFGATISKFFSNNASDVLGTNGGKAYLIGVAGSVVCHALLGAFKEHSRHIRNQQSVDPDDSLEPEVSATLHGAGKGFLQGLWRSWIWPVHLISLTFVFGHKKLRDRRCATAGKDVREKKVE